MVFRRKKNKNFRNNQSKSSIIDHSCASLNFLSIYLIVNKAKIPSLVYHHWQFLSMYRSIFSHQRSKNASIIDSILHLSFILHARIDRNNFLSSKRKNSIAKTQSMRQFHPHNTYLSIFFLFLLTKRSTMYIPNSRTRPFEGGLLLVVIETDFKGIDIGYVPLITSTRRQTEAELRISGLASANSLTGTTHMSVQFANNIGQGSSVTHEFGPSSSLDWFRGRVPSPTSSISSTSISWN